MELEACPPEVIARADVLYFNGFSGFQGPHGGGKDLFVLCGLHIRWSETESFVNDVLPQIAKESGAATLRYIDWIGRDFLGIHWSEYAKRFDVLSAMLRLGISFQTQTKGQPGFAPDDEVFAGLEPRDRVFCQGLLEMKVMKQTDELLSFKLVGMVDDGRCEEWNWTTQAGKTYARWLRANAKSHKYDETREDFYKWPLFQNYDPMTLLSIAPPVSRQEEADDDATVEEEQVCIVCMERAANTMVLPCEHTVVCRECSTQLEQTNNSWRCVKCRQPIEHKLV